MMIIIVAGAFGTVPKGLGMRAVELENRGSIETIQITALLKSTRILILKKLLVT